MSHAESAEEVSPVEAALERMEGGWSIRVPLRREELRTEKRTVVAERILIRRRTVADVEHVTDTIRRERLVVDRDAGRLADLDATQPRDPTGRPPHDTLAGTGMDQDPTR